MTLLMQNLSRILLESISSLKYTDPMPTIAAAPRKLETLQALARTVAQASGEVQVILYGSMLNTVRAIVKDGKIELLEHIDLPEGTEILVTPLLDDTDFWSKASHSALEKVWDNSEDDVYGELLAR
jgi:hypothetical protein